jgi:hypothetical protein
MPVEMPRVTENNPGLKNRSPGKKNNSGLYSYTGLYEDASHALDQRLLISFLWGIIPGKILTNPG